MHGIRRLSLALAVAGVAGFAAPAAANATSVVTISGATSSYPLVSELAARYVALHKNKLRFKIAQGGTTVGLNEVKGGSVTIADVAQEPKQPEDAGLDFYPIAKYAICVVTNKSNTVSNLTQAQLTAIFTGKDTSWSQIPGATASGPIQIFTRTSVAGVLTSFKALLLEGKSVAKAATEEATEGLMRQSIESTPGGIGFLSNYQADKGTVNPVAFNGVACNKTTAASGQYGGVAVFYEVTKGEARGGAAAFIHWIDSSAAAKKVIASQWVAIG